MLGELPATALKTGLERGRDAFCMVGRFSRPANQDEMDAHIAAAAQKVRVLRATLDAMRANIIA